MTIQEDLLYVMFENCPGWASSPEGFLDFILIADYLSKGPLGTQDPEGPMMCPSAKELGEALLKVARINLEPYRDFEELCCIALSRPRLRKKARTIVRDALEQHEISQMLEQQNILPSEESLKSEVLIELMARQLIDRLRLYIEIV